MYKALDYLRRFGYLIRSKRRRHNYYTLNLDERGVQQADSSAGDESNRQTPRVHQVNSSHIQHISTAIRTGIDSIGGSQPDRGVQQADSLEDSIEEVTEENQKSLEMITPPEPDVEDAIPLSDLQIHWNEFVIDIPLPRQTFLTWFRPLKPLQLSGDTWTVLAPSKFSLDWISGHYADILSTFHIELVLHSLELNLEVS